MVRLSLASDEVLGLRVADTQPQFAQPYLVELFLIEVESFYDGPLRDELDRIPFGISTVVI